MVGDGRAGKPETVDEEGGSQAVAFWLPDSRAVGDVVVGVTWPLAARRNHPPVSSNTK